MSKSQLKKELELLDAPRLRELILEVYAARKEFKEYFEFYLNPDEQKLASKYLDKIHREFSRSKWSYSKARVSLIKKLIKEFESFSPGYVSAGRLIVDVLKEMSATGSFLIFSEAQLNLVAFLVDKYLTSADKNYVLDSAIEDLQKEIIDLQGGSKSIKRIVKQAIEVYLENRAI